MSVPTRHRTVLFLCTGNYYRSRFAEVMFNSVATKMGLPWRAASRGLALERGVNNIGPMAVIAVRALEARGVRGGEAVTRMPAQVTHDDLEHADRIIALKQHEHQPLLRERFREWPEKLEYWHVDDVPGVLGQIEREVMGLTARLITGEKRPEGPLPEEPAATTSASAKKSEPARGAIVRIGRETKGRRGKGVTLVWDVPLDESGIRELATTLKDRCGTGGTVKDGVIEIQGDHRDRLAAELERLGYRVKRVGG